MLDLIVAGAIGFFAGGMFGFMIMAVCAAARKGDEQNDT